MDNSILPSPSRPTPLLAHSTPFQSTSTPFQSTSTPSSFKSTSTPASFHSSTTPILHRDNAEVDESKFKKKNFHILIFFGLCKQ